jgi:hypothetical protein
MVRVLMIVVFALVSAGSNAQSFNVGMRIGVSAGGFVTTGAPRDYYIVSPAQSTRYQIRLKGGGEMQIPSLTPPEVFLSYTFRNRFFIQAGSGIYPTFMYTLYALDPEIEDLYNPDRSEFVNFITVPKDYIATRSAYLYPYISFGSKFLQSKAVKPFFSIGFSPAILTTFMNQNRSFEEEVILKDIGQRSPVVFNGRASIGFRFYDLQLEFAAYSNISDIDRTANSYNKRFTSMFLSLGYNFLSFNTVKKQK